MKTIKTSMIAILAATSFVSPAFADMLTALGAGEGQVDIVAWPGYIESGASDKAYDWVSDFEKATSCKVNVKTAASSKLGFVSGYRLSSLILYFLLRFNPTCAIKNNRYKLNHRLDRFN